jgi:cytochrome c
MRKQLLAAVLGLGIFAGGAVAADGEAIFKSKGCSACHKPASKSIGPALKEIAKAYKGKKDQLIKFFKGEADPVVDTGKFNMMKPQLSKTKALSDEEREALADFILKH